MWVRGARFDPIIKSGPVGLLALRVQAESTVVPHDALRVCETPISILRCREADAEVLAR